jgi:spore coat protein A
MPGDPTLSSTRMSFYDQVGVLPKLGEWQVFVFVNTTGDTHPLHIHQSQFQPLGRAGVALAYANADGDNLYDPLTRTTSAAIVPDPDTPARAYEPPELHGWKDVIRVDPGNVVKVAIRFDLPGRYVYHCHVLEHEDTDMMRPLVVTVTGMHGGPMHM